MLRSISFSCALFAVLFLCSCSKKVYTHQQVMQGFHTKNDVAKQFGHPDIIRMIDSTEVWIYNRDTISKPTGPITTVSNTGTDTIKTPPKPNKSIRFMFDKEGNVVGYKSNGVDLGYTKKISAGTNILRVMGITLIIAVIIGLDVYNNSNISF